MRAPQKARPVEARMVQRRPIRSMTHVDTRLTGIPACNLDCSKMKTCKLRHVRLKITCDGDDHDEEVDGGHGGVEVGGH